VDSLILNNIYWLQQHLSAESLTVWLFISCALAILVLLRFYGLFGLYAYNCLAIIFANIQVLRFTTYNYFVEPVALGTVLFTTTFLVNDIITEHYGAAAAKKSVWLGFSMQLLVTLWMVLALGHPLPDLSGASSVVQEAHSNYEAMLQIFTPSVRILLASLIAYVCSQWLDIFIFSRMRKATNGKFLWLRQNTAMLVSGIADTFLFSVLAWMWFSSTPITWHELVFVYVINSQITRCIFNVCFTPLMYMSYGCVPKQRATV
jgi:uncharacterized integral membrane protein (TIGR00697 family)